MRDLIDVLVYVNFLNFDEESGLLSLKKIIGFFLGLGINFYGSDILNDRHALILDSRKLWNALNVNSD